MKLLEEKEIPSFKVGKHRRLNLEDIMHYKKQRTLQRQAAIEEIAQLSQDLGLYE